MVSGSNPLRPTRVCYTTTMLKRWLKQQFNGNPLVEDPKLYLANLRQAYRWSVRLILACVAFMIIGSILFVFGVLYGWF